MAETKKATSKAKKAPAKKVTKKTSEAKATKSAKTTKKAPEKKAPAKAAAKKSPAKKKAPEKKAPVSSTVKESSKKEKKCWKIASIVLGILLLVAIFYVGYLLVTKDDSDMNDNSGNMQNDSMMLNENVTTLLVVEDPACANCNVDLFVQEVKAQIFPDLEVRKVSIETEEGKKLAQDLNAIQVPLFVFSSNVETSDDWAQMAGAFLPVDLNGNKQYLLNPQYIPVKALIEDVEITESAAVIGDTNAPVTIVEFSDYECPFCAIAEGNEVLVEQFKARAPDYVAPMPKVMEEYVEAGKVKIVFYNMPIEQLHPRVMPMHLGALCAKDQDKWEEYHHKLFADREDWADSEDYVAKAKEFAVELGLDSVEFDSCLDTQKHLSQIQEEQALGVKYGVSGTPAFFVGKTFLSGAQDYETFKAAIDAELEAMEASN